MKVIIHGHTEWYINNPQIEIYNNDKLIDKIGKNATKEYTFENNTILIFKYMGKIAQVEIKNNEDIEIFLSLNRLTGKLIATSINDNLQNENNINKEYRKKCNVCGNIFCFTDKDIQINKNNMELAAINSISSIRNKIGSIAGLGSMQQANETEKISNQYQNMIKDYNKCPKCGSIDLKDITNEEINKDTNITNNLDNIKKLKELLDSGAITQEEFDAKKKELL